MADLYFAVGMRDNLHPYTVMVCFSDFVKRDGLAKITIHSLLRTNLTLLLAAGVPLRIASRQGGHGGIFILVSLSNQNKVNCFWIPAIFIKCKKEPCGF
jgi:hypothetical protein